MANSEAGRPTIFTDDISDKICEGIANAIALVTICKPDDMPAPRTVYRWRREIDAFRHNYESARQDQGDKLAEDILSIADNGENDYMEILSKDGKCEGYKQNGEVLQRSKLRVESRKWLASKFNRAFSDRVITELDVNDSFADRILRARDRGPDTEEA